MKNRLFGPLAVVTAVMATLLLFGVQRYGSLDGLWRRANAEIGARQPHPAYVPTPLPVTRPTRPTLAASARPAATATASAAPAPVASATRDQAALASTTRAAPTRPAANGRTPSVSPTLTHPHTPTPSPSAIPSPGAPLPAIRLAGLTHAWQTWNNCGPATLAMNLSFFGSRATQADIAAALRPFEDDKNVNPEELAAYARSQGLHALARVNGSPEILRQLLSAGVPVLIEAWYEPKPNDGMGHYRLLVGFDDGTQEWIAYDSYDARGVVKGQPYAGIRLPYAEVARAWTVFNRAYLLIYDELRAADVARIVEDDLDDDAMWARAAADADAAVRQDPQDAFAWFNLGAGLTALGRFDEAGDAYDQARRIGLPWRMLWYQFGPFRAYYETGRYDEVIALADATLRTARHVEELFFWRGLAQGAKGDRSGAQASLKRALELNPNYAEARAALAALSP